MARQARVKLPERSIVLLWPSPMRAEVARGAIDLIGCALNLPDHV